MQALVHLLLPAGVLKPCSHHGVTLSLSGAPGWPRLC